MAVVRLPTADRRIEAYETGEPLVFGRRNGGFNRVAFSAAHVVADPLADRDPWLTEDLSAREPAVRDSLLAVLREWRAEVGSAGAMAARDLPDDIDAATRAQLEALGYLQ